MNNVDLKLPLSSAKAARGRRFSDTDRTASTLNQLTINKKDGSRESPQPDTANPTSNGQEPESSQSTPLEQHTCSSEECSVTTLFETTELLEIVLEFLHTEDVLKLRRTSRRWNETIKASPSLRLHLFVPPQWSRHAVDFQLLDLKLPGLSIEPGDDLEMGKWIHVTMTTAAARQIFPRKIHHRVRSRSIFEGMRGGLGRRRVRFSEDPWPAPAPKPTNDEDNALKYESLLITQPPISGMQAYVIDPTPFAGPSEPDGDPPLPPACAKVHCENGITLGFLAETAQSLLMDNSSSTGPDTRKVLFKAIVSFTAPSRASLKRGRTRSVVRLTGDDED